MTYRYAKDNRYFSEIASIEGITMGTRRLYGRTVNQPYYKGVAFDYYHKDRKTRVIRLLNRTSGVYHSQTCRYIEVARIGG